MHLLTRKPYVIYSVAQTSENVNIGHYFLNPNSATSFPYISKLLPGIICVHARHIKNILYIKLHLYFSTIQGYKPPDEGPSEYQTIPLNKIEDFGVHCKQ